MLRSSAFAIAPSCQRLTGMNALGIKLLGTVVPALLLLSCLAEARAQDTAPDAEPPVETPVETVEQPAPQASPQPGRNAEQLTQAAQAQYAQGDFPGALKSLEAVLELQKQPQERAETLNLIGLVQEQLQQFEPARDAYQRALEAYAQLKASQPRVAQEGEAKTLNNLGTLYASTEQVGQALGFMERALGLFRNLDNRESEALALRNLGSLYLRAGRGEDAIKALENSLAIEQNLERPIQVVTLLDRLSSLYLSAGLAGEALTALRQAYVIVEDSDDLESKLALLTRIAQLYEGIRRPSLAVEQYQTALSLVEKAELPREAQRPLEGRLRGRIASVFAEAGQNQRAIAQFQKAVAIAEELNRTDDAVELLTRLGDAQRRIRDYDAAEGTYQKALDVLQSLDQPLRAQPVLEGRLFSGLAVIAKDQAQWQEAQDFAQKALTAQEKTVEGDVEQRLQQAGQAVTLNLLGDVYQQRGQYDQAATAYRQSLTQLGPQGNLMLQGANLTNLGAVQLALGNAAEAAQPLRSAIDLWEAVGLESAAGRDRDLVEDSYRLLTTALLEQGNTDAALVAVERRRSRLFRTLLDLRQSPEQEPPSSLSLQQIKAIAASQDATLVFYDLAYGKAESSAGAANLPQTLRIWTVAADGNTTLTTVPLQAAQQKQLQDLGLGGEPVTPSAQTWNAETLQAWGDLLVKPIRSKLSPTPNSAVVVVVPPQLQALPWAAMSLGNQSFLEQHLLTVLPAARLLNGISEKPEDASTTSKAGALILGDPATGGGRSQAASQEVEAIAQLLGTEALTGEAATVRALATQLPQSSVVHLAVPQLNVEGVGEALALASETGEQELNGITPGDLLTLNLQADLVVLHGLLGNVDQPPGQELSMAQAFRAAGAKAVIQSMGNVSEEAAQVLMQRFYTNLQSGQPTGTALRQAMLSIRQDYPNPSDWAGFTLLGSLNQSVKLPQSSATSHSAL